MFTTVKRQVSLCLSAVMLCCILAVPAHAAGTVGPYRSDTTQNLIRYVDEQYIFKVTSKSAGISYTVGDDAILQTFVKSKPVHNSDGTTTRYFGFSCVGPGETGIYLKTNGKTTRLFAVEVRRSVTFQDAVGTDANKYSQIVIQDHVRGKDHARTLSSQEQIGILLNLLRSCHVTKTRLVSQKPCEYKIIFYPRDGSGTYTYTSNGGFSKEKGSTIAGPVGLYLSYDQKVKDGLDLYFIPLD